MSAKQHPDTTSNNTKTRDSVGLMLGERRRGLGQHWVHVSFRYSLGTISTV